MKNDGSAAEILLISGPGNGLRKGRAKPYQFDQEIKEEIRPPCTQGCMFFGAVQSHKHPRMFV